MSDTRRAIAGFILTALPILAIHLAKQTAWGTLLATPAVRLKGDPQAKVLLVEYSDFQCPMCAHVQPSLHQFFESYPGKIRLAYKFFPLTRIHKNSMPAAHAAQCAAEQKQFWPYQDLLFARQTQWASLTDPTTAYAAIAEEVKLDLTAFNACYADPSKEELIRKDFAEGEQREIHSTPTLFVGDERLVGAAIETDGARMIERELRHHQ